MKETKPTTPRLRELEAEAGIKDSLHLASISRRTFISTSEARVEGARMILEDLWPVVEAAEKIVPRTGRYIVHGTRHDRTETFIEIPLALLVALRDALAEVECRALKKG